MNTLEFQVCSWDLPRMVNNNAHDSMHDPPTVWSQRKVKDVQINCAFSTGKTSNLAAVDFYMEVTSNKPRHPPLIFWNVVVSFECQHWPLQKSPHTKKQKNICLKFPPILHQGRWMYYIVFSKKKRRLQGFKDVFVWGFWGSELTSRHLDFFNQGSLGVAWEVLVTNIGRLQWRNLKWFFVAPLSQKQKKNGN